ncbi:conserved exported hypothetical protein [uncultured Paludibacter sp.]|nr:conserved exported hypothetical protein [uncultured Paludibacter sp.]
MKKIFVASIFFAFATFMFNTNAGNTKTAVKTKPEKIEVYYFHFTHRCVTCLAVENETQKALPSLYPKLFKAGKIIFTSVNLDDKDSKVLAEKCKAEGQSLLIISGNKRIDLTDKGFMYAKNDPEKLKVEIKKSIDSLIK